MPALERKQAERTVSHLALRRRRDAERPAEFLAIIEPAGEDKAAMSAQASARLPLEPVFWRYREEPVDESSLPRRPCRFAGAIKRRLSARHAFDVSAIDLSPVELN
jgi:hypothetical protein